VADDTVKKENDQPETEWKELGLYADNTRDEKGELREERLGREDMVNAIAQAIMEVNPPFTFGIYGSWGSGKTHFMQSVKKRLETPDKKNNWNPDPKPIIVFFEAWCHQRDEHPEISMLGVLRNELADKTVKNIGEKIVVGILDTFISGLAALEIEAGVEVGGVGSAKAKVSGERAMGAFNARRENRKENRFETIERQVRLAKTFEETFHKIAKKMSSEGKEPRIVFFIDDLDRCTGVSVVAMLEKIRLFLRNEHCVFVLGADHSIIAQIVKNEMAVPDGNSYLEKIVNFPFYLPPINNDSNEKFFDDKIDQKEEHRDNVIDIFVKASDSARANPRKMILLANTYRMNCYLTKKVFTEYNAKEGTAHIHDVRITAILTALQTLHGDAFDTICAGRAGRENNLKAFFTKPPEPSTNSAVEASPDQEAKSSPDPIETLLAGTEKLEVFGTIRDMIWETIPSEELDEIKKTPFSWYVEFLTSQSEAQQDSVGALGRTQTVIWGNNNNLWRVLEEKDGKTLLLSEKIIRTDMPYHDSATNVTWEHCSLRRYLNSNDFLNKFFTNEEREKIQATTIRNDDNKWYGTAGGNHTEDQIFLLSLDEVDKYFGNSGDYEGKKRKKFENGKFSEDNNGNFLSNQYNESRQAKLPDRETSGWWWLRSPGSLSDYAARVTRGGGVRVIGDSVYGADRVGGVRPAFWVDLKS
jgi:hypothetical protein